MQNQEELRHITKQIINQYNPKKILLFGSQAKGTATKNSDFDICIIADTDNKRNLLTDIYLTIDSDKPIDFLLYTSSEWSECIEDKSSFAFKLNSEGVILYG